MKRMYLTDLQRISWHVIDLFQNLKLSLMHQDKELQELCCIFDESFINNPNGKNNTKKHLPPMFISILF